VSRAAPPEINSGRLGLNPASAENKQKLARLDYNSSPSFTTGYWQLLVKRYAQALLTPFRCYRCGAPSLDPCGRDEKGRWLCESCSGGTECPL
jgi:hypothetical protein